MNTYAKRAKLSRSSLQEVGIEGVLMAISPLPVMLTTLNTTLSRDTGTYLGYSSLDHSGSSYLHL
ncbi:MAG: hypothetical protein HQK67_07625, partial [Desulfamplus sp.]|nr:hypothetical protein [Desulfamplus sp.]